MLRSMLGGAAAVMLSATPVLAAPRPATQPVRSATATADASELAGAGSLGLIIGAAVVGLIVIAIVVNNDDDDTPDSF